MLTNLSFCGTFLVLKRASKKTGARRGAPGDEKFTDTSTASKWRTFSLYHFSLFSLWLYFSYYVFFLFLFPSQACHDPEWTSAAAGVAPLPTCGVKSACYASPSAAWWRQTRSTWWCSVLWLSTPSVWPSSTTTSLTGWPSSCVGFACASSSDLLLEVTMKTLFLADSCV